MTLDYPLDTICAVCGREYGEHRNIDDRCPPDDEETIDHTSAWRDTKFKPQENKS